MVRVTVTLPPPEVVAEPDTPAVTTRPSFQPQKVTVTDVAVYEVSMVTGQAVSLRKTTSGDRHPSVASRPRGYREK